MNGTGARLGRTPVRSIKRTPLRLVPRSPTKHMEQRSRTLFLLLASTLIVALGGGPAGWAQMPDASSSQEDAEADTARKGAPYVPTPPQAVWRMLELADVSSDDVVYDLGSGDGRIVLAAAQRYGARGV